MTKKNSTYYNYTLIDIAEGRYIPRFWCNDTFNNINNTETVFEFIMDAIAQTGISGGVPSSYTPTILNETNQTETNLTEVDLAKDQSVEFTNSLFDFLRGWGKWISPSRPSLDM